MHGRMHENTTSCSYLYDTRQPVTNQPTTDHMTSCDEHATKYHTPEVLEERVVMT